MVSVVNVPSVVLWSDAWTLDATGPAAWCPIQVDLDVRPQHASGFGAHPQVPHPSGWWGNYPEMVTPGMSQYL